MTLVAGIDSSTQSVKIAVCDAGTGRVVRHGSAPHPDGTTCQPEAWWDALRSASAGLLDDVAAISVAGQQHGMVMLDDTGQPVRPALLWNDTRSADAAADLVSEFGARHWAESVGSVPAAAFTVTKLRWLAEHEPANAARAATVLLPHDYLTHRLCGELVTDRGEASGTGYWSPASGEYRMDLLRHAFGRDLRVPRVAGPTEPVGRTGRGALVGPGTGDNMAAALGLGIGPGDAVVSLGTSGTAFATSDSPAADPTGMVAGFADAAGRFLPLACTLNAARVLTATARAVGVSLDEFADLALAADPGANGLVLVPYLDGERTPNLPDATGTLAGMTRRNLTPACLARAAVEGVLCGLAEALDAVRAAGAECQRLFLIGGAAASAAVQAAAATIFDIPVLVPSPAEYVAIGAARQAACVLNGAWPQWSPGTARELRPSLAPHVREAYTAARMRLWPSTAS
ncbi:MAG: xylulokinase [Actinomycetota bacterium]|nr:xylulokinase [Actinomycetota bacterium]